MNGEGQKPDGLAEIGRRFREERSRRGWSLDQVSEKTHIARKYIEAIEGGNEAAIPGRVYLRGFINNYSRVLGIDPEPLLRLLSEEGPDQPAGPPPPPHALSLSLERRTRARLMSGRTRMYLLSAAIVVASGVVVGLGVRLVIKAVSKGEVTSVPPSPFEKGGKASSRRESAAADSAMPVVPLSVTAIQDCWLQVQIDDGKSIEHELKPGDARFFSARKAIRILVGNSAGVTMSGPSGLIRLPEKSGKVVHLRITAEGEEKLEVPAAASSSVSSGGGPGGGAPAAEGSATSPAAP